MSGYNDGSKTYDVVVVGCGLMGSALAKTLVANGYSVAAWNRTPERAEALAGDGITPVRDIDLAVRSSRLAIVCITSYDNTRTSLTAVTSWNGTTLVNLASGSPDEAEEMERWSAERGAEYLDGFIGCYPKDIGTSSGMIVVAGPAAAWEKHEQVLMSLGGASHHVSNQMRAAKVVAAGVLGAFYVAGLGAYVEAAAYVLSQGVSAEALRPTTAHMVSILERTTREAAESIESGNHETDQATIEVFAEGSQSALASLRAVGHRARLIAAEVDNLEDAEAAGLGKLGFYAQSQILTDAAPREGKERVSG